MTKENISRPLTTFIGGILDKLSYSRIGTIIALDISICSIFYWTLDRFKWEASDKHIGLFKSFYFQYSNVYFLRIWRYCPHRFRQTNCLN